MTTLTEARNAIYTRWTSQWGSTSAFVFENEADDELFGGNASWALVLVRELGEEPDTTMGPVGTRCYERRGSIFVHLYTETNQGMAESGNLVDAVRAALEGSQFSSIVVLPATVRELGPNGKWHITEVEMPFRYEEVK